MQNIWLRYFLVLLSLFMLNACGGGSNTSDTTVVNTAPIAEKVVLETLNSTQIEGILKASDKEDKYLKYYIVDDVKHGKVTLDENTGVFVYQPDSGFEGEDRFTYKVFDGVDYSQEAEVVISIVSPTINNSDTQAPNAPVLLSIVSPSSTNISIYWLSAKDDITIPENMLYEVHVSTDANFVADDSTQKAKILGALEADISGLDEDTTYFVKVVAVDEGGNRRVSNELNITTPSSNSVVLTNQDKIKTGDELFLHGGIVQEDKITYPKTKQQILPKADDILFGDATDRVLRKVVSVEESDDTVTIHTKKASLNEVVEKATIETTTLLVDDTDLATQQTSKMMKVATSNISTKKEDTYQWKSGRFAISKSTNSTTLPNNISKVTPTKKIVSDNDDNLYITVKQDKLIAYTGRLNFLDVEVKQTDTSIKIDYFHIKSVTHDGDDIDCQSSKMQCGVFRLDNITWGDNLVNGQLLIDNPDTSMVSDKPYKVTLYAESEDLGLNDTVEVTLDVYIVSDNLDIDANKDYDLDYGITAKVSFTPTVSTKIDIDGSSISYGKISVGGRLQLDINEALSFEKEQNIDKEISFGHKNFTQVYMIAGVPVYQEITIGWSAKITGKISGALKQTIDLTKVYDASFGMEYVNGQWNALKSSGNSSNLTAKVSLGAEGELEVRLIPEVTISFYRAVSSGMSIEPWGKIDFGAHGEAIATTDFDSYDAMAQYGLDKLTATVGLDVNMFVSLDVFDYNIYRWPEEEDSRERIAGIEPITIFSLPELEIQELDVSSLIPNTQIELQADVTNGVHNELDTDGLSWYVFPSNGATISIDPNDKTKAKFTFDKFERYTIGLVGYSKVLGATYGREYVTIDLDLRDLDGDGIVDIWESEHGLDPNDGTDGKADFDGDGYSNAQEYQSRTDIKDASSHPEDEPDTDTTPPVITINGDNPATVTKGGTYSDAGASATDDVDGDVSVEIVSNDVDTSVVGTYHVVYSAKDSAGNESNATREVIVEEGDTTPPVITINGDNPAIVTKGSTYSDAGASATDDVDGDVSVEIVSNDVDTSVVGTYHVVYSAKDSAGNESNATREVKVEEAENKAPTAVAKATPTTATQGEVVTFDASDSSDSDGQIVSYEWKEGDKVLSIEKSFSEDNLSVGDHTITLTVTDDDNATANDSITVTISSSESTGEVKKTGQTKSYDTDGNEVTDGSLKDDGYYQKGVDPSYTRDDDKEVVVDNLTGLMWQDNNDTVTIVKQWLTDENYDICDDNNSAPECYDTSGDTATSYCENLELGGYSDWRLPTSKELEGIVDYGRTDPSIDTSVFQHTSSSGYWSSTTSENGHEYAWNVNFYYGGVYDGTKGNDLYVRCVRDGN